MKIIDKERLLSMIGKVDEDLIVNIFSNGEWSFEDRHLDEAIASVGVAFLVKHPNTLDSIQDLSKYDIAWND